MAFALVAYAFAVTMSGTTLPTPLYPLYQREFGFSALVVTVIYAVYAVGVVTSLVLFGRLSDQIGRRPMLLWATGLCAASAVCFLMADSLAMMLVGRVLSGLSAGIATGTGTAALLDLARPEARERATLIATAANMGGLGMGPLLSGSLAEWAALPLRLCFGVNLVLAALALAAVALIDEPAETLPPRRRLRRRPGSVSPAIGAASFGLPPRRRLRRRRGRQAAGDSLRRQEQSDARSRPSSTVQQPQVPVHLRPTFAAAASAGFAGFAFLGLFGAVSPGFLATVLGQPNRALAGLVAALAYSTSTIGQVLSSRVADRAALLGGCVLLAAGMVAVAGALWFRVVALLIVGGLVAGVGQGLSFRAGLRSVTLQSAPDQRGEIASAFFIVLYLAISVPIVGVGVLAQVLDLRSAGLIFAAAVAVLAVAARARLQRVAPAGAIPAGGADVADVRRPT
ncbi:MAG: MFS transporter [Acidimicrobiia bacterium]